MRKISWILLLIAFFSFGTNHLIAQWVQTGSPKGGYIHSLAEDDLYFYAATFGPIFRMPKNGTTWTPLSTDKGVIWTNVNSGLTDKTIRRLAVIGTNLFAGTGGNGVWLYQLSGMALLTPVNNSTGISVNPVLSWEDAFGAISYSLQVSLSSDFSSTIVHQSGITNTSFSVTNLNYNTSYYWRVSATNSVGTGDWSDIWNFITDVPTG
jgi:hypothetical protein